MTTTGASMSGISRLATQGAAEPAARPAQSSRWKRGVGGAKAARRRHSIQDSSATWAASGSQSDTRRCSAVSSGPKTKGLSQTMRQVPPWTRKAWVSLNTIG